MKDRNDNVTQEIEGFPIPPKRGRPATGQAKTAAERMRAYRARKSASSKETTSALFLVEHLQSLLDIERKRNGELVGRNEELEAEVARLTSESQNRNVTETVSDASVPVNPVWAEKLCDGSFEDFEVDYGSGVQRCQCQSRDGAKCRMAVKSYVFVVVEGKRCRFVSCGRHMVDFRPHKSVLLSGALT